jgi:hypothetical protein
MADGDNDFDHARPTRVGPPARPVRFALSTNRILSNEECAMGSDYDPEKSYQTFLQMQIADDIRAMRSGGGGSTRINIPAEFRDYGGGGGHPSSRSQSRGWFFWVTLIVMIYWFILKPLGFTLTAPDHAPPAQSPVNETSEHGARQETTKIHTSPDEEPRKVSESSDSNIPVFDVSAQEDAFAEEERKQNAILRAKGHPELQVFTWEDRVDARKK